MRTCTYLIIFFLCLAASSMVAQDNLLKDYAPVAPTPASLGKYGDIPVGYHTGVPSISIPIHTLTEGSISVPINLGYHASGIRTQETASWVGLGWALNAGGVITRTVQGAPDEGGNHNQEWDWYNDGGNPNHGGMDCDPLINIANGYSDTEPDIFNFNVGGYTGKFIYDVSKNIQIIPRQDILIETINIGTQVFSGWILTDPQGTRYHFGATDASMTMSNYVEKSVYSYDPFDKTRNSSWYLSKIESADRKDVIQFTYTTDQYSFWDVSTTPVDGGIISTSNRGNCSGGSTRAPIRARIDGRRLTSISGSNGSVAFIGDVTPRQDLSNYSATYIGGAVNLQSAALKTVEIRDKNNSCLRKFVFTYEYATSANPGDPPSGYLPSNTSDETDKKRLILLSVSEQECGSTVNAKTHSFEYYDQTGLPRRLSFAQDHWGYFNGKTTNTSMAPGALNMQTVCNGCQSNYAYVCTPQPDNREPAFPAMRNGTLKKITYPTGGSSVFDYEAHTTWGTDSICSTTPIGNSVSLSGGNCNSSNTGYYAITLSALHIAQGILELKWQPYSGCSNSESAYITIYHSGNLITPVWTGSSSYISYYKLSSITGLTPGDYTVKLSIPNGGIGSYKFYTLNRSAVQVNKIVGGLRIKSITTNDGDAATTNNIIKNYEYKDPLFPTRSSGKLVHKPLYVGLFLQNCTGIGDPDCQDAAHVCDYPSTNEYLGSTCPVGIGSELHVVYASSSLQPMQTTMGSHIGYTAVQVKETGNGQSEYRYNMGQYVNGPWVPTGYPFPPAPYEPLLGTLASEAHYNESGTLLYSTQYNYLTSSTAVINIANRHANKVYAAAGGVITSQYYNMYTGYALLNQTTEVQYNPTGGTFVQKITDIGYTPANGHLQKTTEDVTDSDGTVYRSKYKYAKDYTCSTWPMTECDETFSTANAEGKVIYAMRKRNMVAIPIEQTTWLKRPSWGATFKLTGATYFQFDKVNTSYDNLKLKAVHQVRPASPLTTFTESAVSASGVFTKDDTKYSQEYNFLFSNSHGKILGQWKQNDPAKQQYIWGHNNKLPIAKVINAEDTEVAFTSFEVSGETNTGNWNIQGSAPTDWYTSTGDFLTGRTGFKIATSRTITKNNLPPGKYLVSAWYKDGQFTVNSTAIGAVAGSTWLYAETVVTFASTGTINVKGSDAATFIDELRVIPVDALMRTFSYDDRNQLILTIADENSVPAHFDYDNFQRLQAIRDQDRNIVQTYEYNYQQAGTALNDIKARTVLTSGQTTISAVNTLTGANVRRVFQYMDGLGRPIQINAVGQSPASKDVISIMEYDQYGREPKNYIPYTFTSNSGVFRTGAVSEQSSFASTFGAGTTPFSQSVFEPSPLNRITEQGAPGDTWKTGQGANAHTIRPAWQGNSLSEAIHDFTNGGNFGDNKLWRTETKDENGKLTYTYTDKLGRVVLVKQQVSVSLSGGTDDTYYSRTYTVYDDFGRVVAVIPPEAAKKFKDSGLLTWNYSNATYSSMVYLYSYDDRGRLVSKSVPSGGTTSIAYDRLDRPVLTTDANGFKIFTRYDILGRPVVSGRYKGTASPGVSDPLFETSNTTAPHFYTSTAFPTDNNLDVYNVMYYDDYDIDNNGSLGATETYTNPAESGYETTAFLRTRGKPTAAKTAILKNDNSAPTTYLTTRTYFDKEYSVIQVNKQNHLSGADISSTAYDFANRVTKTRRDHTATPPGGSATAHTIRESYTYDHAGRVVYVYHQINNQTKVLLSKSVYDELDRLQDKSLHCSNFNGSSLPLTQNYLQSVDYSYNIRGWLTGINDPTTCTTQSGDNLGDMFKMSLTYESTATGGTAQYNGNISTIEWNISSNTTTCSTRNLYRFSYDGANRLTGANSLNWSGSAWTASNNYTESGITYDLNGNLKTYTRRGLTTGTSTFGVIDQLTYTYGDALRPDRLTQMADVGSVTKGFKFTSGLTGDHYLYDANGNMTQDKHKNYVIAYNFLNLPHTLSKGANIITINYTADGEKLTKSFTFAGTTKNYVSGIEYSGSALEAIYHGEGRLTPNGTSFNYEYTLKDHLGNARVNFRANGTSVTFLEDHHYYPFGMKMEGISATAVTTNKYMYNSKELNDDQALELYDYGARWYDAAVGRWWSVDPLAEVAGDYSVYAYGYDSPILFVDPTGMASEAYNTGSMQTYADKENRQYDEQVWLNQKLKAAGLGATTSTNEDQADESEGGPNDPYPGCILCPQQYVTGNGQGVLGEVTITGKKPTKAYSTDIIVNGSISNTAHKDATPRDISHITAFCDNAPIWWIEIVGGTMGEAVITEVGAWGLARFATTSAAETSSRILSWGNAAKGHLIKHADALGFRGYTPQQLQKMLPQLRSAANQLYNNIDPALTRIGRWGGQTNEVLMHVTNNGKMLVTKLNGEFITVINKTSNNWYQMAKPLN